MKNATIPAVNKALAAAGHAERLVRGDGYFYFTGGDAHTWPSSSVIVYRVGDLTVGGWIDERNRLAAAAQIDAVRDL